MSHAQMGPTTAGLVGKREAWTWPRPTPGAPSAQEGGARPGGAAPPPPRDFPISKEIRNKTESLNKVGR